MQIKSADSVYLIWIWGLGAGRDTDRLQIYATTAVDTVRITEVELLLQVARLHNHPLLMLVRMG